MEHLLAIFLFAVSTSVTPGPNNLMIMTSAMNYGIKRSLPHFLGICVGFPIMVIGVGLGFDVLFKLFPILHDIIKVLGILYLLYLAWKIANTPTSKLEVESAKPLTFIQAAIFQWLNPKALIMATGAIATYSSMSTSLLFQVCIIALVFFASAFPCVGVWLLAGAKLKTWLKNERQQRLFNFCMAGLLVLSIVPVLGEFI
ncbi:LysE family translocator [Parashewanella curva]|uniref:LysE family translocator n=1 Tax=Parashewanella curva TaxID=2338552 RepID=A0A3L8Q0A6_9GAMM|nr:LysE family translocator [Parashewanella curva]RLV61136.1 LysE family translocator [Parashewanella curva]